MITPEHMAAYTGPALLRDGKNLFLRPHTRLQPYIAGYMLTCPAGMPERQMVLPTASTTLVYALDGRRAVGGLRGVNTRPVRIGGYAGGFPLLALVEFHPAGLYPFLKIPQGELLDKSFLLQELDRTLDAQIQHLLERADSAAALKDGLDRLFLSRLDTDAVSPSVLLAIHTVLQSGGGLNGAEVARTAGYSEKQLGRLFRGQVGTGVKTFSRIVRANRALRLLAAGAGLDRVAERGGYYDSSHLVRELRALCGVTPRQYRDSMSVFYSDPFKL